MKSKILEEITKIKKLMILNEQPGVVDDFIRFIRSLVHAGPEETDDFLIRLNDVPNAQKLTREDIEQIRNYVRNNGGRNLIDNAEDLVSRGTRDPNSPIGRLKIVIDSIPQQELLDVINTKMFPIYDRSRTFANLYEIELRQDFFDFINSVGGQTSWDECLRYIRGQADTIVRTFNYPPDFATWLVRSFTSDPEVERYV